jgi:4-amino-4-deoxy-L-arabinose transferase-like glycosyltransferase
MDKIDPSPFNSFMSRTIGIFASMPLSLKLAILVLITLLTRVMSFLQTPIISNDGVLYIQLAKDFSEGKFEALLGTPFSLYPLLISFVQKFIGDWELTGQLISLILSTLTVIPVFLLGRSLYSEKVGWLSALFYITLPNFLRYSSDVVRDPTSWFFMTITLWLVWSGIQKNRAVLFGLASISAGLGALTRVEGLILWGALALFTAFSRILGISLKKRALNVTLLIFLLPALLLPVQLYLSKQSSKMVFGQVTLFPLKFIEVRTHGILQPSDPVTYMGSKVYKSLPSVSQNFLELASRHKVVLAISEVIYKFIKSANILIVLILLGLWRRKKEGFESSDWYLLFTFAALFIMSIFYTRRTYYFSTRHGLTLVLPFLYFAGPGLIFMTETFSQRINRLFSGWHFTKKYVFHILTIFLTIIFLAQGLSAKRTEKINFKEIGLWLKEKGYQGSVIMASDKSIRLVFYADGKFLTMPDSWKTVIESINRNGVKIVVIDPCTIKEDCPDFLANLPGGKLFPLQGPKGKAEKCALQIYGVR